MTTRRSNTATAALTEATTMRRRRKRTRGDHDSDLPNTTSSSSLSSSSFSSTTTTDEPTTTTTTTIVASHEGSTTATTTTTTTTDAIVTQQQQQQQNTRRKRKRSNVDMNNEHHVKNTRSQMLKRARRSTTTQNNMTNNNTNIHMNVNDDDDNDSTTTMVDTTVDTIATTMNSIASSASSATTAATENGGNVTTTITTIENANIEHLQPLCTALINLNDQLLLQKKFPSVIQYMDEEYTREEHLMLVMNSIHRYFLPNETMDKSLIRKVFVQLIMLVEGWINDDHVNDATRMSRRTKEKKQHVILSSQLTQMLNQEVDSTHKERYSLFSLAISIHSDHGLSSLNLAGRLLSILQRMNLVNAHKHLLIDIVDFWAMCSPSSARQEIVSGFCTLLEYSGPHKKRVSEAISQVISQYTSPSAIIRSILTCIKSEQSSPLAYRTTLFMRLMTMFVQQHREETKKLCELTATFEPLTERLTTMFTNDDPSKPYLSKNIYHWNVFLSHFTDSQKLQDNPIYIQSVLLTIYFSHRLNMSVKKCERIDNKLFISALNISDSNIWTTLLSNILTKSSLNQKRSALLTMHQAISLHSNDQSSNTTSLLSHIRTLLFSAHRENETIKTETKPSAPAQPRTIKQLSTNLSASSSNNKQPPRSSRKVTRSNRSSNNNGSGTSSNAQLKQSLTSTVSPVPSSARQGTRNAQPPRARNTITTLKDGTKTIQFKTKILQFQKREAPEKVRNSFPNIFQKRFARGKKLNTNLFIGRRSTVKNPFHTVYIGEHLLSTLKTVSCHGCFSYSQPRLMCDQCKRTVCLNCICQESNDPARAETILYESGFVCKNCSNPDPHKTNRYRRTTTRIISTNSSSEEEDDSIFQNSRRKTKISRKTRQSSKTHYSKFFEDSASSGSDDDDSSSEEELDGQSSECDSEPAVINKNHKIVVARQRSIALAHMCMRLFSWVKEDKEVPRVNTNDDTVTFSITDQFPFPESCQTTNSNVDDIDFSL